MIQGCAPFGARVVTLPLACSYKLLLDSQEFILSRRVRGAAKEFLVLLEYTGPRANMLHVVCQTQWFWIMQASTICTLFAKMSSLESRCRVQQT
jgi:hypothetical protein